MMKLVRNEIEPTLLAAGFVFDARNNPRDPAERVWIDYTNARKLFTFGLKPGTGYLIAEMLDESGGWEIVAKTAFDNPRTRAAIMATITAFASAVREAMIGFERAP